MKKAGLSDAELKEIDDLAKAIIQKYKQDSKHDK